MSNEKKNIEIEAIGEFGLIEELTSDLYCEMIQVTMVLVMIAL